MKSRDSWRSLYEMENSTGYATPAKSPERQGRIQEHQHPDCRRHWVEDIRRLSFFRLAAVEARDAQRDVVSTEPRPSEYDIYHTDEAHRTFLYVACNFRMLSGDGKNFVVGRGW